MSDHYQTFAEWSKKMNPCVMSCDIEPEKESVFTQDVNSLWLSDKNISEVLSKIIQYSQCDVSVAEKFANKKNMTDYANKHTIAFDNSFKGPYRAYLDLDIMINDFVSDACHQIRDNINMFGTNSLYHDTPIFQNLPYRSPKVRRRKLADVERYLYVHNTVIGTDVNESYTNPVYKRERPVNPFASPQ